MAGDLSAPLGGKKTRNWAALALLRRLHLPVAPIAFGLAGLILLGVVLRIALVSDPQGGRPVADVSINSTHNANTLAGTVSTETPAMATITAEPETAIDSGGASIVSIDDNLPEGNAPAQLAEINDQGVFPELTEKTEQGAIPRIGPDGRTPFVAYSRASATPDIAGSGPMIAIVVTGLGLNEASSLQAASQLPGAITMAFAPYGRSLDRTVGAARAAGHEILLEVPLEPFDFPDNDPGPDTLLTGQPPRDNINKLFTIMAKFGGYVGLINHMGARFTASAADFNPMMEELGTRGLGYLDDGSSNRSLAPQLASANLVPFGRADMALDLNPARAPILAALAALEAKASENGSAIGVISALPVSIATLTEWAKSAPDKGFVIVPVSALMKKS